MGIKYTNKKSMIEDGLLLVQIRQSEKTVNQVFSDVAHELEICKYDSEIIANHILSLSKLYETGKEPLSDYQVMPEPSNSPLYNNYNELELYLVQSQQTINGAFLALKSTLNICLIEGGVEQVKLKDLETNPPKVILSIAPPIVIDPCAKGYHHTPTSCESPLESQSDWVGSDSIGYCCEI